MTNIFASFKESIRLVYVISGAVYKAASKERLMYGFLIVSMFFVLMANAPFFFDFSPVLGDVPPEAIALQIGFMGINLFLMLISIFITLNLLQEMFAKDVLIMLLSKPIRRWQMLEGIFLGVFRVCFLNWFIMTASLWLVIFVHLKQAHNYIWLGTSVSLLLIMIYISLMLFFYTFIPNAISGILTFFIVFAGFGSSLAPEVFNTLPVLVSWFARLGVEVLPKVNDLNGISMNLLRIFELESVKTAPILIHTFIFLLITHIVSCYRFSHPKQ